MNTTNEFAFARWCNHAGNRKIAGDRIYDLKHEPMIYDHWFAKIFVAVLYAEEFFDGLAMDFWNMFWRFK